MKEKDDEPPYLYSFNKWDIFYISDNQKSSSRENQCTRDLTQNAHGYNSNRFGHLILCQHFFVKVDNLETLEEQKNSLDSILRDAPQRAIMCLNGIFIVTNFPDIPDAGNY